jgi:demethylmenaquinone methyltransferase/2-methoxy-6-polyprenyl-1,4-benzoquinol methylase
MKNNTFSFDSAHEKAIYVNAMFCQIAGGYDRMNRILSLGRDQAWRRRAVQLTAVPPGGRLLDVAIGTGGLALTSLESAPSVRVTGVDFTIKMMHLGQRKERERLGLAEHVTSIGWTGGEALRLPYPDAVFDAVMSGFVMRNVTDVAAAFAEQRRVVRPGGHVVCLEITHPTLPLWRRVYPPLFGRVMPVFSGLISGQPDAYRYLPASLDCFVGADELKAVMESVGLRGVGYQKMMLGTVAIHVGVR